MSRRRTRQAGGNLYDWPARQRPDPALSLLWLSFLITGLLGARILYSGELTHAHLLWNLFLAWLPLLFAILFRRSQRRFMRSVYAILWLLFLPNAPYLITDLIHLAPSARIPVWYDAVLLFTAALAGLLLGLRSLLLIHLLVRHHYGPVAGSLLVLVVSVLTGFGIYVGRFLRWNSWDAFLHPLPLAGDLINSLATPHLRRRLLLFVVFFATLKIFAYLFLFLSVSKSSYANPLPFLRAGKAGNTAP